MWDNETKTTCLQDLNPEIEIILNRKFRDLLDGKTATTDAKENELQYLWEVPCFVVPEIPPSRFRDRLASLTKACEQSSLKVQVEYDFWGAIDDVQGDFNIYITGDKLFNASVGIALNSDETNEYNMGIMASAIEELYNMFLQEE